MASEQKNSDYNSPNLLIITTINDKGVVRIELNDMLKQLSNSLVIDMTIVRGLLSLLFILLGLAFRHVFVKVIVRILLKLTEKTKTNLDNMLVGALEIPARAFILGVSLWASLSILSMPAMIQNFLNLSLRSYFILILFWFFYRASGSVIWVFESFFSKADKKVDMALIRFLRKSLKIMIVVLGVFMVIKEWGYDVSGLLAGLGVGGLAFALAAKDAVSNLLGSITIMLDKPFSIGDWIETEKIEGVVEEIGLRSTKIRTFAQALVSVPNSIMSNEPITNWSKMGKRRVTYTLHIPLDTPPARLETLMSKLKDMLKKHADIHKETIVVNLEGFGDATLKILFYFFTKTTSWVTYLAVSEDVSLKVLRIFEEVGVPMTLPAKHIVVGNKEALLAQRANKES